MDDQDNQDEKAEFRSHEPKAMAIDDEEYLEASLAEVDRSDASSVKRPNSLPFHEQKWFRLRRHYNDQYLELFRMSPRDGEEDASGADLPTTQLGAVVWYPSEKEALYNGLSRKGRHDLRGLSDLIGSKSEVEVKVYLDNVRQHETDRQRFEPQTKNVSHAEIPAAIEIGPECEILLNRAAEALAAFQEQYDHAAGQRKSKLWLIDQAAASVLDRKADEADAASDQDPDHGSSDEDEVDSYIGTNMFHLSTFLDLSEQFFMNQDPDRTDNWHILAEQGQRPALTIDVVTSFHDILVNFTRRLIQSCLFMAQSRIRASTTTGSKPSKMVRPEDVAAALSVLDVKPDSDSFWIGMARRNKLSVVEDVHRKGFDRHNVISYEEVEAKLSKPRRTRSMSIASQDSLDSHASSIESLGHAGAETDDTGSSEKEGDNDAAITSVEKGAAPDIQGDPETASSSDEQSSNSSSEDRSRPHAPLSRQRRIELLEEEQDEYMERMDQEARRLEESRLLQLLGAQSDDQIKPEEEFVLGPRPRVMRKTVQDCSGWSAEYQPEWEYHGEILPLESFAEVGSRVKRRRLDSKDHTARDAA